MCQEASLFLLPFTDAQCKVKLYETVHSGQHDVLMVPLCVKALKVDIFLTNLQSFRSSVRFFHLKNATLKRLF